MQRYPFAAPFVAPVAVRRHPFRPTALAAAIATMVCAPHSAAAAESNTARTLPQVEVSATPEADYKPEQPSSPRYTQPLVDTPQTITVVPETVIKDREATTLRDVLRNVSGISMQAGEGGTPVGDQLSVRGFGARTDIFVDNVRDIGGYTRDPFNFEQVEVVKGPSSSYSGRGSTGGSINLATKRPGRDAFTTADITLGTDAFSRLTLDANTPLETVGNAAFRVNLMRQENEVAGRDVVENERWGVAPSMTFGLGSPTQVTFSLFHMVQDNIPDYGIPWVPESDTGPLAGLSNQPAPVDYSNFYGLKARDFEDVTTTMATALIEHRFNDVAQLRNTTRWGETDRDSIVTAPRFDDIDTSTDITRGDWKGRDQEDSIVTNVTDLILDLKTGAVEHTIVTGFELTREEEKRYTIDATGPDSPTTDLYNPNPDDPYLENIQRTGALASTDADTVAAYLADTIKLNEQWELNGGLRWERYAVDYQADDGTLLDRTDTMTSYRAGVVYKPVREGSIYMGYGTSFNPAAEGLTLSSSPTNGANADVAPEESRTLELGTKWELLQRRLFVNAAVFRTEKTNARTQDPDDPNDTIVLDGEQHVDGLELGAAGSLTEAWQIFAGYTFLDSEIDESNDPDEIGNELSNTPEHSFSLWTTYDINPALQVGAGAQYVGERYNNNANLRQAPDYWVYDAMASYRVHKNVSVRLNVQNLTDEKYIDYVGGGHFIPGVGRTVLLGTSINF